MPQFFVVNLFNEIRIEEMNGRSPVDRFFEYFSILAISAQQDFVVSVVLQRSYEIQNKKSHQMYLGKLRLRILRSTASCMSAKILQDTPTQ